MATFHPEHYFPIAFFIIMSLNLLGVAGLVASKSLRLKAKRINEGAVAELVEELNRATQFVKFEMAPLRWRLSQASLTEIRKAVEELSGSNRPALEIVRNLLEESGRFTRIAETASGGPRWRRIDCLVILGHLKHPAGLLLLRRGVRAKDPDISLAAISALGIWDSPQAVETLVGLLGKDCPVNPSRVATIIENTKTDVATALCHRARSADSIAQYWCAKLLGKFKKTESLEMIHELLEHPNANVRAAAVETLGKIGGPLDEAYIVRMLKDRDWVVRVNAIHACGERRLKAAIPHLTKLFGDPEWWVRADAREAVERIGPEALDHLIGTLENSDRFARNTAAQALDNMGFVDAAIWDLTKGGPSRERALKVLGAIRTAEGAPALSDKIYRLDPELFGAVSGQLQLAENG